MNQSFPPLFPIGRSPAQESSSSRSPSKTPIQILIVDDHPAINEALTSAISREVDMAVMETVETIEAASAVLKHRVPDVVVADLSLADGSGLTFVKAGRALNKNMRFLIYSMYDEGVYAAQALRAGALGYVCKSRPTHVVISAIRSVDKGEVYLSKETASRILRMVIKDGNAVTELVDQLTGREMTVFTMIGKGYSIKEIASQLKLDRKTVETYRRRTKEKLGYDTVDELLRVAVLWTEENPKVFEKTEEDEARSGRDVRAKRKA